MKFIATFASYAFYQMLCVTLNGQILRWWVLYWMLLGVMSFTKSTGFAAYIMRSLHKTVPFVTLTHPSPLETSEKITQPKFAGH